MLETVLLADRALEQNQTAPSLSKLAQEATRMVGDLSGSLEPDEEFLQDEASRVYAAVWRLAQTVDHLSFDGLFARAEELLEVATELVTLYAVPSAEDQPVDRVAAFLGDAMQVKAQIRPRHKEAVQEVRDRVPKLLLDKLIRSLKIHYSTEKVVAFLEEQSGISLENFTDQDQEDLLVKLSSQLDSITAKKSLVTTQLEAAKRHKERAQSFPGKILFIVPNFLRKKPPGDEVATLSYQLEAINKEQELCEATISFLGDSGGYAQLQKLRAKLNEVALVFNPPSAPNPQS